MNSITFELDDCTIQIVNDLVYFWKGQADHEAEIILPWRTLSNALSTAGLLRRD